MVAWAGNISGEATTQPGNIFNEAMRQQWCQWKMGRTVGLVPHQFNSRFCASKFHRGSQSHDSNFSVSTLKKRELIAIPNARRAHYWVV
jgi:hypothetical protein